MNNITRNRRVFPLRAPFLLATVSMIAIACSAQADTIAPTITPTSHNNGAGVLNYTSGIHDLTGSAAFTNSHATDPIYLSLQQAYAGLYMSGATNPATLVTLSLGSQSSAIAIPDPISGGTYTVNTYATSSITQGAAGGLYLVYPTTPAGEQPFYDARLATVSGGATLNFNVNNAAGQGGAIGNWSVKNTVYITVTDGTANWASNNHVYFTVAVDEATPARLAVQNVSVDANQYAGVVTVNTTDGAQTRTVSDLTSFQDFNDWLIQQLTAGKLGEGSAAQAAYNAAIASAYTSNNYDYIFDPGSQLPLSDPARWPVGTQRGILANSANAVGHIVAGGGMFSGGNTGAILMDARNGATIINDGTIQNYQSVFGMTGYSGSHVINNGVRIIGGIPGFYAEASPDIAVDNGTTYENNGIVNILAYAIGAGNYTNRGLYLANGATGTNNGTYNVGTISQNGNGQPRGIEVRSGGTFTNNTDGVIYLGREAGTDTSLAPMDRGGADVVQANGATGIYAVPGSTSENKGNIVIGDKVQNGVAMWADDNGAINLVNSGTITVNGHYSATPMMNIGILSTNNSASANVRNDGIIDLVGVNGIGIKTIDGVVSSAGTINVAGGQDPATGLRNYGIWAEGSTAKATVSGSVNLMGDGAIGVHARDGATIVIASDTAVKFQTGTNQIGYFAYGAGSQIVNNATQILAVSTEGSMLFRVENGADYTGSAATELTAIGNNSVAVVATGRNSSGDVSAFNSGSMTIKLDGADVTGVVIEGGAQGKIEAGATINLNGVGAIAAIVDGQKHDLSGAASGAVIAGNMPLDQTAAAGAAGFGTGTILVTEAALNSSTAGVTGYVARNSSWLTNAGQIAFTGAGSHGIDVLSSTLDNQSDVTVNGVGVYVEGANSVVTLTSGVVKASDGEAAIKLGQDVALTLTGSSSGKITAAGTAHGILIDAGAASLIVSDVIVDLAMSGVSSGNGIENRAEISGIKLTNAEIDVTNGKGIRTATNLAASASGTINVSGSGMGLAFETASGGATGNNFDLSGSAGLTINGTGAGSTGILARTTGTVATAATVAMTNAASGAALVVGTASASTNTGSLTSQSLAAPVVDLSNGTGTTFSNTGTVRAVDVTHNAVLGSSGNDTVNMTGGAVQGIVAMAGGTNTVNWTAGTLNGSIEMGTGSNNRLLISGVDLSTTYHLDGATGSGDELTFSGVVHRGGSFAADDLAKGVNLGEKWETLNFSDSTGFTLTDNLTLAGSTVNVDATSTLYAGGGVNPVVSSVAGTPVTVNNAGMIDLSNGGTGPVDRLTIIGNYVGQDGMLVLETQLGSDNSPTDRLVISGGTAMGHTSLSIIDVGGSGALTQRDGIMVVQAVNGATTAPGAFMLANRVAAGAYEYTLYQGGHTMTGGNPNDQNWYLRNTLDIPLPDPDGVVIEPDVREEVPVDMVIPSLAIEYGYAMLGTLHERVGETYIDATPVTEERVVWCKNAAQNFKCTVKTPVGMESARWASSGWARLIGDRGFHEPGNFMRRGPDYDYTFGGIQAGLDIFAREQADGTLDKAGIYVGYGQITSNVKGQFGGKAGSVDMDAYTVGGYWTHFAPQGWYTDAVVQGTWYTNTRANSVLGQTIKPDGFGILASLEGGYAFKLGSGWTIEPQAQIAYQNVSFDNARDAFGVIRFDDSDSLRGRLGVRVTKSWNMAGGAQPRLVTAWLRANVWHEFLGKSQTSFGTIYGTDLVPFTTSLGGTWGEIGAGVTAQVADRVNLFATGSYSRSLDNKGRETWSGRLGATVKW